VSLSSSLQQPLRQCAPNLERPKDHEFFSEFYPDLKALFAKNYGALYWKGALPLVDGSHADVVVMEDPGDGDPCYLITTRGKNSIVADVSVSYRERRFRSARQAVLHLEKDLNKAIYLSKKG